MVVLPNFVGKNVLLVQVVSVDICIRKGKTLHSYKAFKHSRKNWSLAGGLHRHFVEDWEHSYYATV